MTAFNLSSGLWTNTTYKWSAPPRNRPLTGTCQRL
jgi:hypothetical protein